MGARLVNKFLYPAPNPPHYECDSFPHHTIWVPRSDQKNDSTIPCLLIRSNRYIDPISSCLKPPFTSLLTYISLPQRQEPHFICAWQWVRYRRHEGEKNIED
eukprot:1383962-Amorphochlora_amoeboformis.AAC.1